jgi:hypothetical protein
MRPGKRLDVTSPLGCHPDRFHEFLTCRSVLHSGFGVAADAVGTLRDMGDSDGDQLLHLRRQGAIRKYRLAERLERVVDFGSELLAHVGQGT